MAVITQSSTTTEVHAYISRFTVDGDGCTARLQGSGAADYRDAHLGASHASYNAIYSLLLACWINQSKLIAKVKPTLNTPANTTGVNRFDLIAVEAGSYADSTFRP